MNYELTKNTKIINDHTLYQIKAIKDFGDIKNYRQFQNMW
jgi:hypothetical protein